MIAHDKRLYVDLAKEAHGKYKRGLITKEAYWKQYRVYGLNWHKLRIKEMAT